MSWIVRYARIGNASPVYCLTRPDGEQAGLCDSVKEVAQATGRPLPSARIACKEAREEGESWFLS